MYTEEGVVLGIKVFVAVRVGELYVVMEHSLLLVAVIRIGSVI